MAMARIKSEKSGLPSIHPELTHTAISCLESMKEARMSMQGDPLSKKRTG